MDFGLYVDECCGSLENHDATGKMVRAIDVVDRLFSYARCLKFTHLKRVLMHENKVIFLGHPS